MNEKPPVLQTNVSCKDRDYSEVSCDPKLRRRDSSIFADWSCGEPLPKQQKGTLMKAHFNLQGSDKPVNGFFIGTSPELEIALYTLCFVTRADNDCLLKLANNDVTIVTHTFRYRSKNLIGSAYPQIPLNWN